MRQPVQRKVGQAVRSICLVVVLATAQARGDAATSSQAAATSRPAAAGVIPALAVLADPVAGDTLATLAALLEVKLSADARLRLVEREAIQKVLGEQELQALFGATDAAKRISVGELIKADLLVLLRTARQESGAKAVDVVVCETRAGLRLRVETLSGLEKPEAAVAGLQAIVDEALAKYVSAVRYVVAVPPFVSKDFLHSHDDLKRRCSRYAQQSLETWPELVLVELEEAEAIAEELAVAGKERSVDRQLPLYLLGEYSTTEKDGRLRVSMQLMVRQGGRTLVQRLGDAVAEDDVQGFIVDAARKMIAEVAGGSSDKHDPVTEAAQLVKRARVFMDTAHWEEAMDLVEAAALLQPDDLMIRQMAIDLAGRLVAFFAYESKPEQHSRDLEPGQPTDEYLARASRALAYARRGLVHTEKWIRLKDLRDQLGFAEQVWFAHVNRSIWAWRRSMAVVQAEKDVQTQCEALTRQYEEMLWRVLEEKVAARAILDSSLEGFASGLGMIFRKDQRMRFIRVIQDVPDTHGRIIDFVVSSVTHAKGNDLSYRVEYEHEARDLMKPAVSEQVEEIARMPGCAAQRAVKILRRLVADARVFWSEHEKEVLENEMMCEEDSKRRVWVFRRNGEGKVVTAIISKGAVPEPAPAPPPPEVRRPSSPLPPADIILEPLKLMVTGQKEVVPEVLPSEIRGWMPCGEGYDFAWTSRAILLMKRRNQLEVAFAAEGSELLTRYAWNKAVTLDPFYDGRLIWAGVHCAGGFNIIAIDPRSGAVSSLSEKNGLPPISQGLQLASVEPGKVCVAGAFGPPGAALGLYDRAWCGLVSLGSDGNVVVDMLVEASRQRKRFAANTGQVHVEEVFVPIGLLVLPAVEGGSAKRVLILRGDSGSPGGMLIVDLDTRQVTPSSGAPSRGFQQQQLLFDGRLYVAGFAENPSSVPVWEFSLPDPHPEEVGSVYRGRINRSDGAPALLELLGSCPMAIRGDDVHVIRSDGSWAWWVGRCPSTRMYPLRVEWPKAARAYGRDCWIRQSSHYGIVAFAGDGFYRAQIKPESLALVEPRLAADAAESRRQRTEERQMVQALTQRAIENRVVPASPEWDEPALTWGRGLEVVAILIGGVTAILLIRQRRSRRLATTNRSDDTNARHVA